MALTIEREIAADNGKSMTHSTHLEYVLDCQKELSLKINLQSCGKV